MATVKDIYEVINEFAAFDTAMSFDNVGILVGEKSQNITACIIALDVTREVISLAKDKNAKLIITHHPIIFHPLKSVTDDGQVYNLAKNGISVISAHTNLDAAIGGVNDALAEKLCLVDVEIPPNADNMMRIGKLEAPLNAADFARKVKQDLNATTVTVTHGEHTISKVAVLGGGNRGFLPIAMENGADALVTGETPQDMLIDAINADFTLITAGHYATEAVVLEPLKRRLSGAFKDIDFTVYDKMLIESV